MSKKALLFAIVFIILACKSEKKEQSGENYIDNSLEGFELVEKFIPVDMNKWRTNGVDVIPTDEVVFNEIVFYLTRNTTTESAYYTSTTVPVVYSNRYRVSIRVRKGANSSIFGLRLAGEYPDRADAIFDLEKGSLIKQSAARDFENPKASIEALGDGWYKCMLTTDVLADDLRIIFGATSKERNVSSWEGKTESLGDLYFTPASITIEEELLD